MRVTVPGLPVDDEETWEPFLSRLEEDHGEFGPIMTWTGGYPEWPDGVVVLATDADNEEDAVNQLVGVVRQGLKDSGLTEHAPTDVEVELVVD